MFKKILTVLFFMIFVNISVFSQEETGFDTIPTEDEPISAGIKYNEASARVEAFKDVERKISKDIYRDYLKDKNKKENLEFIDKKIFIVQNKRILCPFYSSGILIAYSVTYLDNPEYSFYYNTLGMLFKFDKDVSSASSIKTYGYSRYGNLVSVTFTTSESEQFVYNEKGKLLAHWQDDKTVNDTKLLKMLNLSREK